MTAKWNVILEKEKGDVVIDSFDNKKEAEEEIQYRYTLCRHLGYTPDISYKLQKI